MNLRNHRKLMVVDGKVGFIGGLNLRAEHFIQGSGGNAIQDLHFKLGGPVVEQIQQVFIADWRFTTGEQLSGESWLPRQQHAGNTWSRSASLLDRTANCKVFSGPFTERSKCAPNPTGRNALLYSRLCADYLFRYCR